MALISLWKIGRASNIVLMIIVFKDVNVSCHSVVYSDARLEPRSELFRLCRNKKPCTVVKSCLMLAVPNIDACRRPRPCVGAVSGKNSISVFLVLVNVFRFQVLHPARNSYKNH